MLKVYKEQNEDYYTKYLKYLLYSHLVNVFCSQLLTGICTIHFFVSSFVPHEPYLTLLPTNVVVHDIQVARMRIIS